MSRTTEQADPQTHPAGGYDDDPRPRNGAADHQSDPAEADADTDAEPGTAESDWSDEGGATEDGPATATSAADGSVSS
ncbi:MAG: hypothetical protein JWQ74_337 [Marmoricola sp.]|nr:hypothetical protein [Marmoricola sp.]